MKRFNFLSVFIFLFSFYSLPAWGLIGPYCNTNVTLEGGPTVQMSFIEDGTNSYKIVINCDDKVMSSINGWAHTSVANDYHLGATGHYTITNSGHTVTIPISSTTAPKLYNNLYISFSGEGERHTGIFNENDINWSTSCVVGEEVETNNCNFSSSASIDGIFSNNYLVTFNSAGDEVTVIFTFNEGTITGGYIHDYTGRNGGFVERAAVVDGNEVSYTLTDYSEGDIVEVACKINVDGGIDRKTTTFNYKIGTPCNASDCEDNVLYFVKSDNQNYVPMAYLWYSGDASQKNAAFPGEEMTLVEGYTDPWGKEVYKITWENNNLNRAIFSKKGDSNTKTGDLWIDDYHCQYWWDGRWLTNLEQLAEMVYFVNTPDWADNNVKIYEWQSSGSLNNGWPGHTMTYTGWTNFDGKKIFKEPVDRYDRNYDRIKFSNNGSNVSAELDVYGDEFFNYQHNKWYANTGLYLKGSFNNWAETDPFDPWDNNGTTIKKTLVLNATTTYQFKVYDKPISTWRGKTSGSTITADDQIVELTNTAADAPNAEITTGLRGAYTFIFDFTCSKIKVQYPILPHSVTASLVSATETTVTLSVGSVNGVKYHVTATGIDQDNLYPDENGYIKITRLLPNTNYSFTVKARDEYDNESTASVSVNATTLGMTLNTIPTYSACQVQSLWGTQYTNKGWTFGEWNGGCSQQAITVATRTLWRVSSNADNRWFGLEYGTISTDVIDASDYDKLIFDVWTEEAVTFNICLINASSAEYGKKSVTTNARSWTSVEIDNLGYATTSYQIKIDGFSNNDIFIGDAYFLYTSASCDCSNLTSNLAIGKDARAGYSRTGGKGGSNVGETPDKAVDGNLSTNFIAWGAASASEDAYRWWAVDLGYSYELNKIVIYWQQNGRHSEDYVIQVSDAPSDFTNDVAYNNASWTTIREVKKSQTVGATGNTINVTGTGRYVRIIANDGKDIAISEFEVYACQDTHTPPTMTSATVVSYTSETEVVLNLQATDENTEQLYKFKIVEENGTEHFVTANNSHQATLTGLSSICQTLSVYAIEEHYQLISSNHIDVVLTIPSNFNLALNKTATASVEVDGWNAAKAVDPDVDTYWATGAISATTTSWWGIDLGNYYNLSQVEVAWNNADALVYYWEVSVDGINYYPLSKNNTAPSNYTTQPNTPLYETYNFDSGVGGRYLRTRITLNNGAEICIRDAIVNGGCYSSGDNPIMTFASLVECQISISDASAIIDVGAWDDVTTFDNLTYNVVFTAGGEANRNGLTATDGILTLSGLTEGTTYTVRIYAVDEDDNVSSNYKELTFTPALKLYYFTGDGTGVTGVWEGVLGVSEANAAKRRFQSTATEGVYLFTIPVVGDNQQYRLYFDVEGNRAFVNDNNHWSVAGNQHLVNHNGETVSVYAKDKDHFVSNFDHVYVIGPAVGASTEPEAAEMTYDNGQFIWEGAVTAGNFRIMVKATEGATPAFTDHSRARIMDTETFANSEDFINARLIFEPATWTWWWEEISADGVCIKRGGPGDGCTECGTAVTFTDGYVVKIKQVSTTEIRVTAQILDERVGLGTAYFQNYVNKNPMSGVRQYQMTRIDDHNYTATITTSSEAVGMTEKVIDDWTAGVGIRYGIKFEFAAGGYCITGPDYYYMQNGCAPDLFTIYHHGQAPVGERESFEGGTIVQPIEYRRKFDLDTWYSIYFPFVVTAVKVYNETDDVYYDILPYYRKSDGTLKGKQYIIRRANPQKGMAIDNFTDKGYDGSNGWYDPKAENDAGIAGWLPQKNTPYIIQFHNAYYADRWICFYGEPYSDISNTFSKGDGDDLTQIVDEHVNIYGNKTMMSQTLSGQSYHLNYEEYGGMAWTRYSDHTLYPFECYILANTTTTARYKVLRKGTASSDVPTPTDDIYTVSQQTIVVYSLTGQRLLTVRDATVDEVAEQCSEQLTRGVYLLQTDTETLKLIIGGK